MNTLSEFKDSTQIVAPDAPEARSVIQRHSRSFSIASKLLPKRVRKSVYLLYGWCRTVDDAVDEASNPKEAEQILSTLDEDLGRILLGEKSLHPASAWIQPLIVEGKIEVKHARELIGGMRLDLLSVPVQNNSDLRRYCYHAAGTVGLMMTRIMGVKEPIAARHAIALGIAMQLTNIARDVLEDAERGRSYLPGIADPLTADPRQLRTAIEHILDLAERNYSLARDGIKYLDSDLRPAIRIALALYREIGSEIRRNEFQVLNGRAVVGKCRLGWVLICTRVTSMKDDIAPFFVSIRNLFQEKTMNDPKFDKMSTVGEAKQAAYLGLSLTLFMSTALFAMVFMNPKEPSYSYLPLLYSGVSLMTAIVFNRIAARCEQIQPAAALVKSGRTSSDV
jgi:15-cis-phytoene synthase